MTTIRIIAVSAIACAAAVSLSGCGTLGSGPSSLAPVIDSLAHAGCTGELTFSGGVGSAMGLSPGAFHAENTFRGACDPRNGTPTVVPAPAPVVAVVKP